MGCSHRARFWGTASFAAIAIAGFAQTAIADENVETVVVTAERRATDVQKTSIAVTVLTEKDLRDKHINVVDQLQFTTPSLAIDNFGQGNEFNIRGIGKGESNIQTPSGVVTYRDGIPVLGTFIQDQPYYDLASVEVLRGPQGTFAGTNATGGAIFIVEQNPTLNDSSGYWQAGIGNYGDVAVQGATNIPLTDDLAMRVALNAERRDTFWNISKGIGFSGDPGSLKEIDGRVSFLWDPQQNLEVKLKFDGDYIDTGGYPADGTLPSGSAKGIFNIGNDTHNMGLDENFRAALDVKYTLDNGIAIRSLSGYQLGRAAEEVDLDGTNLPFLHGIIFRDKGLIRIFSEEINVISPDTGPFTWVLGGFFEHETDTLPSHDGFDIGLPQGGFDIVLAYHTPKQHEAVFGQATYNITDQWQIQAGLRFNHSTFDLTDIQQNLFGGVPSPPAFVVPCVGTGTPPCPFTRSGHEEDSKLTGKVALNYQLDEDNYLYTFFATGHKDGGQNTASNQPANILPEEVRNAEVGWKSTLLDGHVRTQIDGYWNDYKNFQVTIFDSGSQQSAIRNAPSAKIWGFEGQVQGAWDKFSFDLNAAYLHSRFGSFFAEPAGTAAGCNAHTGGADLGCQNLSGEESGYAPKWTFNGGLQYRFDMINGYTLTPRVDYAYVDKQWASVFQNPLGAGFVPRLGARNIVNVQLSYEKNNWDFTAYATNLLNFDYVASENVGLRYAGTPRQYGFRLSKTF
jgi:iron complex outermembrane receptor protein